MITMNQINQLPLETVIKNLADSVAVQFHLLSKKCVTVMKNKLEYDEKKRQKRREILLAHFKAKQAKRKESFPPKPVTVPQEPLAAPPQQNPQPQQSRLARINRIKEAMFNKKIDLDMPAQPPKDEMEQPNINQIAFQHFSYDLRPQILAKYPSALPQKVNKVIIQKWNTFEPAKKEAYIKKIKKKLELKKKFQNQDRKMQPEFQQVKDTNTLKQSEVKRQEIPDEQKQSQHQRSEQIKNQTSESNHLEQRYDHTTQNGTQINEQSEASPQSEHKGKENYQSGSEYA